MFKKIKSFFDRAEDKTRFALSRVPIIYALIGAVGIILMWKGVGNCRVIPYSLWSYIFYTWHPDLVEHWASRIVLYR